MNRRNEVNKVLLRDHFSDPAHNAHPIFHAVEEDVGICYILEPWYDRKGNVIAQEMLLRMRGLSGKFESAGKALEDIGKNPHLATRLDANAVHHSLGHFIRHSANRVSFNLNTQSATSHGFWDDVERQLRDPEEYAPKLIFEIREDLMPLHTDTSALHRMREQGVEFAIDDFSGNFSQLQVFGRYASYCKFDGSVVRHGLEKNEQNLRDLLDRTRQYFNDIGKPDMRFIAEFVETPSEAFLLHKMGFDAVQGRDYIPLSHSLRYDPTLLAIT